MFILTPFSIPLFPPVTCNPCKTQIHRQDHNISAYQGIDTTIKPNKGIENENIGAIETADLFETSSDVFVGFDSFTKTKWLFKALEFKVPVAKNFSDKGGTKYEEFAV